MSNKQILADLIKYTNIITSNKYHTRYIDYINDILIAVLKELKTPDSEIFKFIKTHTNSDIDEDDIARVYIPNTYNLSTLSRLASIVQQISKNKIFSEFNRVDYTGKSLLYDLKEANIKLDEIIAKFFMEDDPTIDYFVNVEAGTGKTQSMLKLALSYISNDITNNKLAIYVPTIKLGAELLAKIEAFNTNPSIEIRHIKGKTKQCYILNSPDPKISKIYTTELKTELLKNFTSSNVVNPCRGCAFSYKCEYYSQYTDANVRIYSHAHYPIDSKCEPQTLMPDDGIWTPTKIVIDEDIISDMYSVTKSDGLEVFDLEYMIELFGKNSNDNRWKLNIACYTICEIVKQMRQNIPIGDIIRNIESTNPGIIEAAYRATTDTKLRWQQLVVALTNMQIKREFMATNLGPKAWMEKHMLNEVTFNEFTYTTIRNVEYIIDEYLEPVSDKLYERELRVKANTIFNNIKKLKFNSIGMLDFVYDNLSVVGDDELKYDSAIFCNDDGDVCFGKVQDGSFDRLRIKHLFLDASANSRLIKFVHKSRTGKRLNFLNIKIKYADNVFVSQFPDIKTTRTYLTSATEEQLHYIVQFITSLIRQKRYNNPGLISYLNIKNPLLLVKGDYIGFDRYLANKCNIQIFEHFGALRGKNKFEECDCLFIVGREYANPEVIIQMARMLKSNGIGKIHSIFNTDIMYSIQVQSSLGNFRNGEGLKKFDGYTTKFTSSYIDPLMEDISLHTNHGETYQAMHRLRLIHTHPIIRQKEVFLLNNIVLDANVDTYNV